MPSPRPSTHDATPRSFLVVACVFGGVVALTMAWLGYERWQDETLVDHAGEQTQARSTKERSASLCQALFARYHQECSCWTLARGKRLEPVVVALDDPQRHTSLVRAPEVLHKRRSAERMSSVAPRAP